MLDQRVVVRWTTKSSIDGVNLTGVSTNARSSALRNRFLYLTTLESNPSHSSTFPPANMASGGPPSGNIKVVVRCRPFNNREKDRNARCIVSMKDAQTVLTPPPPDGKNKPVKAALEGSKTFAFDKSYWSFDRGDPNYAGQEDVFNDLGKPLLQNAFQGYNNCIFGYEMDYYVSQFGSVPVDKSPCVRVSTSN